MRNFWGWIQAGYLRLIEPIIEWFVRHGISPNVITTVGTGFACLSAIFFATGHISTAGWTLGLPAFFAVVDGTVARRTGDRRCSARSTTPRWTGSLMARSSPD